MNLQEKINKTFTEAFGRTPLKARLDDIMGEAEELIRYTDLKNLKEETGDLLATVIQLANECGWDIDELINENCEKIKRRIQQYKSLHRKKKVAILGGAFDPPHIGHLKLAQFVLNSSKTFDEVYIMPCYKHMYNKEMLSTEQRLEMCNLAVKDFGDNRIKVSDYETFNELGGETYTLVNNLLEEDYAKDEMDFSMIIGYDNALSFDKWVNYEHLERMIRFVVVSRAGVEIDHNKAGWCLKSPHIFLQADKGTIPGVSSTAIRSNVINSFDISGMVTPSVENYIKENKLYTG
jgi:nicotinate-nucleotide adenylyltransferase